MTRMPMLTNEAQTVLIVDDTAANLGVIVDTLEARGLRVAIAQDGEEGYQRALLVRPALILLDVMMPGPDGFEVCRRLKQAPETSATPVIIMTSLADTEHVVAGFDAGAVDYVTKPLRIDEVMARVFTHLKLAAMQNALSAQRTFLQQVIDITPHLVFAKDRAGRYTLANHAMAQLMGIAADDIIGRTDAELLAPTDAEELRQDDIEVLRTRQENTTEREFPCRDGVSRIFHTVKRPILDSEGEAQQVLGVTTDITTQKRMAQELERLAYHENLTGLPNRLLFMDRLNQALVLADRHTQPLAVLLFDLDRFKEVNDTMGHAAGDQLLQEVARRVAAQMRASDTLCRFGGDEFAAVLPLVPSDEAVVVAEKIRAAIAAPFRIQEVDVRVAASIGIALAPLHARDADTLLRCADLAMYQAKKAGGNGYRSYGSTTLDQ